MRERNPCFFDRLRRLGWNVRLGIEKYLLLIRSAVLGQTESINQPSHYRQTRDGDPIGDGTFLHPNPNASTDPFNLLSARDPLVGCAPALFLVFENYAAGGHVNEKMALCRPSLLMAGTLPR